MKLLAFIVAALFAVVGLSPSIASAQPSQGMIYNAGRPGAIKNRYIVVLKDTPQDSKATNKTINDLSKRYKGNVKHAFKQSFKGFVSEMSAANARQLAKNPKVMFMEQDATAKSDATQTNLTTWGLDRIDQRALPLSTTFTYPDTSASDTTAYVIDSGIRLTHSQFGGRATSGWDFVDNDADASDCSGHGTHVAGTIGGSNYGIAKDINLVSVRVLNCNNSGTYSSIIAAIDWVTAHADGPAVANMSLGGVNSLALDNAVQKSVAAGITYVVSAGNKNADACTQSPARTADAITVAASNETDQRWTSSNYGACVDIFAPGTLIRSSYGTSDTATARMTGTSTATPHVSGVAALIIAANPSYSPAQVTDTLLSNATTEVLSNLDENSPDRLLFQ